MFSQKKKALLSLVTLLLVLAIPLAAFAATYSSTLHFDSNLQGATRSYSAGSIAITVSSPTCTLYEYGSPVTVGNPNFSSYYSVKLYRKNLIGSTLIGTKSNMSRYYTSTATWTNMIAGDYYFSFSKDIDNVWVNSSNVTMTN